MKLFVVPQILVTAVLIALAALYSPLYLIGIPWAWAWAYIGLRVGRHLDQKRLDRLAERAQRHNVSQRHPSP